jgi:prepilin peptidase CpaA
LPKAFDPIVVSIVAAAGLVAAVCDLRTRRVPNELTSFVAALGLSIASARFDLVGARAALVGLVVGGALMLPGYFIGATGAGDVKLLAALGAVLGPTLTLTAFLYSAIAGGLFVVAIAARRKSLASTIERAAAFASSGGGNSAEIESGGLNNQFAYAPAIAIGAFIAALGF